jgi:hypothetical protein
MNGSDIQNVDAAGLRKLYRSDQTARLVLDSFAARYNSARLTTVSSLMSLLTGAGFVVTRPDIIRVFKALQSLNCGDYIQGNVRGDRNKQSRFVWKVYIAGVGKIATDTKQR